MRFLAAYKNKTYIYWLIKTDLQINIEWFVNYITGMYSQKPITVKKRKSGHFIVRQDL